MSLKSSQLFELLKANRKHQFKPVQINTYFSKILLGNLRICQMKVSSLRDHVLLVTTFNVFFSLAGTILPQKGA